MSIQAAKLFVMVGGDTSGADKSLAALSSRVDGFGKEAMAVGQKLTTWITLPLMGIAAASTKLAADFDRNMNVLQATSGATAEEMEKLREQAQDLGADLNLPATSAADAGEAMLELSKAGLKVNDVMAASRGVLQLSAAGALSNAEAAEIASNALNAFGLAGEETTRIADMLAAAANASSAEVTDLADSMRMASAVFSAAGIPIEDLTAALGEMANKGMKGRDAGTSLKQMILSLQAPSQNAAELMQELGISIYDANGNMVSMEEMIRVFSEALGGLTQQQRNQALATIFGSDAIRAANVVLMGGVDAFNQMKDAVTEQGAAAELAGARMEGLGGVFEKVRNAAETAMLAGIEPLADDIVELADRVAEGILKFSEWDESTRALTVKLGLLVAGVGPALTVVGGLTRGVNALALAAGTSAVAVGVLTAAVTAAIGVYLAWQEAIVETNEEGQKAVTGAYTEMLNDQAEAGKSAVQVADEFVGAQKRVQKELDSTAWYIRIFIKDQEALLGNYGELSEIVLQAATDYEDYRNALQAAAEANGLLVDEEGRLVRQRRGQWGYYYEVVEANYMLSEAVYEAREATQRFNEGGMAMGNTLYFVAATAAGASEGMQGMGASVEEVAQAVMEADDILGILADTLADAGWNARDAQMMMERMAGQLDATAAAEMRLENDVRLVTEAFARGLLVESDYVYLMGEAQQGTLMLSDAQRQQLQSSIDQAIAFEEAARAAQEYQVHMLEMAMSLSAAWESAVEAYNTGIARIQEEQARIAERIAELQQRIKDSSDPKAIAGYREEIAKLKKEASQAADEMGKLADEMRETIEIQMAQAALNELEAAYQSGQISFEEYMTASTQVAESFGLINEQGQALALGLSIITAALGEGKISADQYDEALQTVIDTVLSGSTDMTTVLEQFATTTTSSMDAATEGVETFSTTMTETATDAGAAAQSIASAFTSQDWYGLGTSIGQGIASGLAASQSIIEQAAKDAAAGALAAAKAELESESPSKKFYQLGVDAMVGFAMGVRDKQEAPIKETAMATAATLESGKGSEGMVNTAWQQLLELRELLATSRTDEGYGSKRPIELTVNIGGRELRRVMVDAVDGEISA